MKPLRLRARVKREQGLLGSAVREGIPLARGADGLSIWEGASGRNQIDKELSRQSGRSFGEETARSFACPRNP